MKKSILITGLMAIIVLFNACKKDQDFLPEDTQEAQPTATLEKRSCGMHDHTQKLLQNPDYRRMHELKFEKVNNMVSDRAACSTPTILPIAVHFQGVSNPDEACLRQLAQSQVDILNNDYAGTNGDITEWTNNASPYFPGINNGETCVEFCIATQNHPSGYGLSNGDLAVTINKTSGDNDLNWSGYINIFVQANTGVLGYSPLGGSGNGDGVVIDANAFGSGSGCGPISPQSPYNLGRTLTHELGHYLLLDHIWGGGCGNDDGVADTPDSQQEYYDCPNLGVSSCSSTDMHMNYMDYTNDACMYMFSAGQSSRMENYFNSSLPAVINNAANVCGSGGGGGGGEPTCEDGIMNGDETGIDCGGANCPGCEPPTSCDTPSNIQSTVDGTDVSITWDAVPGAIKYRVRYRIVGQQWTGKTVTANSHDITGLQPNTTYQYQVRTICAEGEKSPFSTKDTFTTEQDGGGGTGSECGGDFFLGLSITLDDWGSETEYELVDENGNVIGDGGPFQDGTNGQEVEDDFCLEDGCYYLAVYDAYGDGICCEYGNGHFEILDTNGDILVQSDGYFGYVEYIDFCVENGEFEYIGLRRPANQNRVTGGKKKSSGQ